MSVLRLVLAAVATVCLLLAGAWLVADRYARSFVLDELAEREWDGLVDVGEVRLPSPGHVRMRDMTLTDPETGDVIASLEQLDAHISVPSPDRWDRWPPDAIHGRGGRLMLSRSDSRFGLQRAIDALSLAHQAWKQRTGAPTTVLPPIELRDVEIVLLAKGLPLESIEGCTVWLHDREDSLTVIVDAGRRGGVVTLVADQGGLRTVHATDLGVSEAFTMFLPEEAVAMAADVRPSGRLDLSVEALDDGSVRASGILRDATLHPARVPFPLERVRLPFEYADGRFRIRDGRLGFGGGELLTSVEHDPSGTHIAVDVVDAEFRREFLQLFPESDELTWLRCEDGGNVELHLEIERRGGGPTRVRGWGGVLLDRLWIGPTHVEVEDLVGSFDIRDEEVIFRETSGACASGVLRVRGMVNLLTGAIEFEGSAFDVNLAEVRRELAMSENDPLSHGVTGWLQGDVRYLGVVGNPNVRRGDGQFSVRGGNLWRLPLLDAVRRALAYGEPGPSERHRLEVQYRIRDDRYEVDEMRLESEFLSLLGNGRIRNDGNIRVDFIPISLPLGPIGEFLEYLQRQFVKVEVRGNVVDPEVRVIPLKIVTNNLISVWEFFGGLFGSDEEEAAPQPALTPQDPVQADPVQADPAETSTPGAP